MDKVEVAEKKRATIDDDFLAYCEAEDNYRNTSPYANGSDSESEPEAVEPIMTRE